MNPYVAWLKSNIPIVVLVVVMIAAAVALPIVSGKMNKSLQDEVKKRAGNDATLQRIATTTHTIEVPGQPAITSTGPANPKTIDLLGQYEQRLTGDVAAVRDLILSRNRQGRELLVPDLFPQPQANWRDFLQFQFWRALMNPVSEATPGAYPRLLNEVGAGLPPSRDEIQEELRRQDELFRTQKFAKSANEALNAEEQEELRNELQTTRMLKYQERAQQLDLYASLADIDAPYWNERDNLELRQIFDWEWQLWIKQDVLKALHNANSGYESLVLGPVKRVRWLSVAPLPTPSNTGSNAQSAGSPFGGGGVTPATGATTAAAAAPPDPKVEAQRDYKISFTGRVSNSLYDVRLVRLSIVVDTARIPEVLNAIGQQNLMTVLDLKMRPTDAYADLAEGYFYGANPTSDLELLIETVWLREWTAPLMPAQVKEVLVPPVP